MEGSKKDSDLKGVIPRAIDAIIEEIGKADPSIEYFIKVNNYII